MASKNLQKMADDVITELERPDFIPKSNEGAEHFERDDVKLPQLMIAQALSPELEEDNVRYIPGLKLGDFFNGLTGEIYGRGPLKFMIVRADRPRYVEFIPRSEGGGVRDPNVPPDDPRTQFTVGPDGKRQNPVATKFYDYVLVLLHDNGKRELVVMSLKSTGIKVARNLNGLIRARNAPIYSGVYTASSKSMKNTKGTFYQFDIRAAGWPKTPELIEFMKEKYEVFKDKELDIDRKDHGDEDTSFPHGANVDEEEM